MHLWGEISGLLVQKLWLNVKYKGKTGSDEKLCLPRKKPEVTNKDVHYCIYLWINKSPLPKDYDISSPELKLKADINQITIMGG